MNWLNKTSKYNSTPSCTRCGAEISGIDITFHSRKEVCPNCSTELRKWSFSRYVVTIDVNNSPHIIQEIVSQVDNLNDEDARIQLLNLKEVCEHRKTKIDPQKTTNLAEFFVSYINNISDKTKAQNEEAYVKALFNY